ncbi:MAG: hypothetical protein WD749_13675 [Phycisphaerales bacterium]
MAEPSQVPTGEIVQLSVSEALKILSTEHPPIKLAQYRPTKSHFEIVPFEEGHGKQLHTIQGLAQYPNGAMAVQTEFNQFVPLRQKPDAETEASATLSFMTWIAYEFQEPMPSERDRQVFARMCGIMHSWPFWRAFVYSTLADSGFATALVPLIQLPQAAQMAGFKPDEAHPAS